jgi:eukaryotic-like serine/threonine-protein kinase
VGSQAAQPKSEFGSHVSRAGVSTFDAATRRRLSIGIASLLVVLVTGALAVDRWLTGQLRAASERELLAAHGGQVEALRLWAEDRLRMASAAADSRRVKKAATRILVAPAEAESLEVAAEEGSTISEVGTNFGFAGWAIVRADGTGFGYTDHPVVSDLVIGQIGAIQSALGGEPAMSDPLVVEPREGVPHAFADRKRAIFVAVPLKVPELATRAVLVFRIDPNAQFDRILGSSRAGRSEETYAISRSGLMVSRSRHEPQLKSLGLPSAESLVVTDPGADLTRGQRPSLPREQWPLTRAASAATRGSAGSSLVPYRDYRGVPVVGMWTWLPSLQIGVVTEIAASDAFLLQRSVRRCFWVLGVSFILASLLVLVVSIRASRLAKKAGEAEHLGQYRIVRKIGEGGMGAVFLAEHAMIRRPTALKMFTNDGNSPEQLRRFEREVQVTAQLTHPNTVAVYDYGRTSNGVFYYVMEMIDGIDLDELVMLNGPMPLPRALHVARQLAGSLAEAHSCGIVHRDVKPANIMLTRRGGIADFVKVLDFGLAREHDTKTHLTQAGVLLGTPLYMAPELLNGSETASPRSDVYAAGCVLFYLLTGKDAFSGTTVAAIIARHAMGNHYQLDREMVGSCPAEVLALVNRCIALEANERFRDGGELSAALEDLAMRYPWSASEAQKAWQNQRSKSDRPPASQPLTTDLFE